MISMTGWTRPKANGGDRQKSTDSVEKVGFELHARKVRA